MSNRTLAAIAAAALAVLAAGCGGSIAPQIHSDSSRLPVARQLYAKGDYSLVVDVLGSYVQAGGTGSADIDQAVYLLGMTYLRQHEWANAQTQFERIGRDYPESDSAAAAAFHLGDALWGQSRGSDFDQEYTLKALDQWQSFLRGEPADSDLVHLTQDRIAACRTRLARKLWRNGDLYVKQGLYEQAQQFFRNVMSEYPDTPIYGDALIGLAVADARLGRKDTALVVLQGLEKQFEGYPLGLEAAKARARVQKWPAEGDRKHRAHRTVETVQPPPVLPQSSGSLPTP